MGETFPYHRNLLLSLSICFKIEPGIGNRDMQYVGILSSTLLMRVSLPPIERYCIFHVASLFSIFSITPFQIPEDLKLAPQGKT